MRVIAKRVVDGAFDKHKEFYLSFMWDEYEDMLKMTNQGLCQKLITLQHTTKALQFWENANEFV